MRCRIADVSACVYASLWCCCYCNNNNNYYYSSSSYYSYHHYFFFFFYSPPPSTAVFWAPTNLRSQPKRALRPATRGVVSTSATCRPRSPGRILDSPEEARCTCRAQKGAVLGPFWNHFWNHFGPFWDRFGTILGPFWDQYIVIPKEKRSHNQKGTTLEPLGRCTYSAQKGAV